MHLSENIDENTTFYSQKLLNRVTATIFRVYMILNRVLGKITVISLSVGLRLFSVSGNAARYNRSRKSKMAADKPEVVITRRCEDISA